MTNNSNITSYMTKYERARILGTRALQISMNAPVMIDIKELTGSLEIAEKELETGNIPFIICRYLTNSTVENWAIEKKGRLRKINPQVVNLQTYPVQTQ